MFVNFLLRQNKTCVPGGRSFKVLTRLW